MSHCFLEFTGWQEQYLGGGFGQLLGQIPDGIDFCMTALLVIKILGKNPGACPWDEAKKYFSKSLMSISSEYNRSNSIKGTFN